MLDENCFKRNLEENWRKCEKNAIKRKRKMLVTSKYRVRKKFFFFRKKKKWL